MSTAVEAPIQGSDPGATSTPAASALRWAALALIAITWASAAIFGVYILAFYGGAVPGHDMGRWNATLPRLYEPHRPLATTTMGLHFAAGGILLLLGPVQLIGPIRRRWPAFHRWTGRLYAGASLSAGLGGLCFIASEGTVGGAPMTTGFGLYGVLMVWAAVETIRHARARRMDWHRASAIRLFVLALGSWLYRMDYGFWAQLTGGTGHTDGFDGPFDVVMAFFFYLPNLLFAELFIRGYRARVHPVLQALAALVLTGAAAFLLLGTYYFTVYYWWPGILGRPPG